MDQSGSRHGVYPQSQDRLGKAQQLAVLTLTRAGHNWVDRGSPQTAHLQRGTCLRNPENGGWLRELLLQNQEGSPQDAKEDGGVHIQQIYIARDVPAQNVQYKPDAARRLCEHILQRE